MSGEHCVPWETFCGGRQAYQGLVGDLARCVEPTAQAPPARRAQVVPGQSVAPGLLEGERPGGECGRNAWNRGHDPGWCPPSMENETAAVNLDD